MKFKILLTLLSITLVLPNIYCMQRASAKKVSTNRQNQANRLMPLVKPILQYNLGKLLQFLSEYYCIKASSMKSSKFIKTAAVFDGLKNLLSFKKILQGSNIDGSYGFVGMFEEIIKEQPHKTALNAILLGVYGSNVKKDYGIWKNSIELAANNSQDSKDEKAPIRKKQYIWLAANYLIPYAAWLATDRHAANKAFTGYELLSRISEVFRKMHLYKNLYKVKKVKK